MRALWKHQLYAVDLYSEREFCGLLLPTGTGKTLTATRIAENKDKPVLIIAPNALCGQWKEELLNKDEETRITTKDWEVLVCTSKTKNTKKFKKALEELCQE
jgi:superfamily II DNA or RNA helicase